MHQIDRRVGFEQVAPHPLAGMRLARNQQHLQPVAHAVDDDHGAVVDQGQLVRARIDLEFEHVRAAMVDRDRERHVAADRHHQPVRRAAILAPGHCADARSPSAPAFGAGKSSTRSVSVTVLADQAEARRLRRRRGGGRPRPAAPRAARAAARRSGASCGRLPAGTSWTSPSVIMTTPARRCRGTSDIARFSAANSRCRRRRRRARGFAGADDPHVEVAARCRAARSASASAVSVACRAVADLLARRFVDDDDGDVVQRRALFLDQRRVDERCRQQQRERGDAPGDAARAPPARRTRAPAPRRAASAAIPSTQQRRSGDAKRDRMPACRAGSLAEPLEDRRHVHLIGLVVAGQHVHDEVDRRSGGHLALHARRRARTGKPGGPRRRPPRRRPNRCRRR